jgi:hypothetical protein
VVALEGELGTAVEITGIYFHRGEAGSRSGDFGDFRISMGLCDGDSLTETFENNWMGSTMTEVFSRETVILDVGAGEWFGFRFDTPYFYGGTHDLLVEISWTGGSGSIYNYQEQVGEGRLCLQAGSAQSSTGYWSPRRCQFALEGTLYPDFAGQMDSLAARWAHVN